MLGDIDEGHSEHIALFQIMAGDNGNLRGARAEGGACGRLAGVGEVRRDGVKSAADLALGAVGRAGFLDVFRTSSGFGLVSV